MRNKSWHGAVRGEKSAKSLDACEDYASIFAFVKFSVENTIGSRRAGLSLGLANLPLNIGAFHQIGSNLIVMNRTLLSAVLDAADRRLTNAYVFHVLLHEYLHSLGVTDEGETAYMARGITEAVLGKNHIASRIARDGIGAVISHVGLPADAAVHAPDGVGVVSITDDIETENLNYFG